jgi:hypothetical protein
MEIDTNKFYIIHNCKEATMASFSQDKKWMEAKKVAGHLNWLEVISYYRSISGEKVFVYAVVDEKKQQIIDVIDDDTVLLLNKQGDPALYDYNRVLKSKKIFKYSESYELKQTDHGPVTIPAAD